MSVCLVTPNDADRALATGFLAQAGIEAASCGTLADFTACPMDEIGCVVLVEEALGEDDLDAFRDALDAQPAWSDLPLLLIARETTHLSSFIDRVFPSSGNFTLLQRPIEPVSLVSAVSAALRARQRQYQVRDLLEQRSGALRKRDEFLAMLAHELRNPLAPIRNAVYLLGTLDIEDPMFVKCRAMIEKQAQHITRLVDDLLDVSRLELGKVDLHLQQVDLNQSIAGAAEACLPMTTSQRHTVQIQTSSEPLLIRADAVRIEQVFGNLIINAAKFTPPGGAITVEATREGGLARITVSDTGHGIDPSMLDSVFDLFVQGQSTLARTQGGLGIGLTLVRRLVNLHGGTVSAHSEGVGRGSRFEVRFPLAAPAATPPHREPPEKHAEHAKRVLIVEDSQDIRESLGLLLANWRHHVEFAETGHEAVTRARAMQPDVALIDIGLPGMDGYAVARNIRESGLPWARRVKLIALTGYGQASDRDKAIAAGFDVHLLKPVDPATLEGLLA